MLFVVFRAPSVDRHIRPCRHHHVVELGLLGDNVCVISSARALLSCTVGLNNRRAGGDNVAVAYICCLSWI